MKMGDKQKMALSMAEAQESIKDNFLPVAKLHESMNMFLDSVEPLLTESEFLETKLLANDFTKENGEGEKLYQLLLKHNEETITIAKANRNNPENFKAHPDGSFYPKNHWLENWWETYAYQSDRTPLATLVNCFQSHFGFQPCSQPLIRAAWSIVGGLDFQKLFDAGRVPPETAGRITLCSAQYFRLFGTTRVPGKTQDTLVTFADSNHICVERRGYWYLINNVKDLSVNQIATHLRNIVDDARGRPYGPGVAAYTGVDRTKWANNREHLMLHPGNRESLEWIEKALFHVVLSEDSPTTKDEVLRLGAHGNGKQIWFDKSSTHIVFENGRMISNLEHSHADAVVPARYWIYMDLFTHVNAGLGIGFARESDYPGDIIGIGTITKINNNDTNNKQVVNPLMLTFHLDDIARTNLAEAEVEMQSLIDDHIITCLDFEDFGAKSIMQNCGKISTDSFVQVALALAYYRDQGKIASGYETASTRGFFHGRTETIRAQSIHTKKMCEAFENASLDLNELEKIVHKAAEYHRNYLRRCMAGNGADRVLLGMKMIAMENGIPLHPFYSGKAYTYSSDFTLSTSQMPFGVEDAPGFGAYSPNAYGCCYRFTHKDKIIGIITSRRHSNKENDAERFRETIKQAFRDLYAVLSHPSPKL